MVYDVHLKKNKIYSKSIEWIVRNYKNANQRTLPYDNEKNGKIVAKASSSYYSFLYTRYINYDYTLVISIKENKIKVLGEHFVGHLLYSDQKTGATYDREFEVWESKDILEIKSNLAVLFDELYYFLEYNKGDDF